MVAERSIHLCLVSEDLTLNLTPLLNEATRPEHIVLLYASEQLNLLEGLMQAVASLENIDASVQLLTDVCDADAVRKDVLHVLSAYKEKAVALNASGGNRLTGLVATQVFQSLNKPVFYVDASTDQVIAVYPPDAQSHQLTQRIAVPQYLMAAGYEIQDRREVGLTSSQRAFAQELLSNVRHYSGALAALNWLAASAGSGLQSKYIESWHMSSPAFIGLLDRLRDVGLAHVTRNCLVFPGEAQKFFVNGGWLQDYARQVVAELQGRSPDIHGVEHSVLVGNEGGQQVEVDAMFLVNNRLHLIECRAKKLKKGNAKNGAEAIHRLDELMTLREGLQAKSLLLSYRPLREVDLRRMQLMGIKVLQEKQLHNLRFYLEEWIAER
uniref:DUF1887 domain-containing protein n=1 Tax=uncultured Thiotrichaceae bacterium TaxID=298394 RepID=A0A6S6UMG0_9GAMM|nr:MAG: DUF1887 domain-containing protein [uncultured Thiotrichaceae bacterium]